MWKLKFSLISKRKHFLIIGFVSALISFFIFNEYKKINLFPINIWEEDQKADCAIVLTGGAVRVREGFDLLNNGNVKKLIVSGVHADAQLREIMPLWPFYTHLKEEDVVLERYSGTTFGNAQQTLPIVEALGCREILLVTSQIHMYRSYKTFKAHFSDYFFIYPHPIVSQHWNPPLWDYLIEAVKSLFYSLWAY